MDSFFPDGVIVINKPAGPTSHDIVAVMRRVLARAGGPDGRFNGLYKGIAGINVDTGLLV